MRKNVLLIMPEFYNYQEVISQHIKKMGFNCYVFNEEPDRKKYLFLKNIKTIFKTKDVYKKFRSDLLKKITSVNCIFDYVIIIRGNILNEVFLQVLKQSIVGQPKWIYYTWDSLKYLEHHGKIAYFFDDCYSFDSFDVQENKKFKLLPLFYDESYSFLEEKPTYEYDYCSIAGFSKERYECVKKIMDANPNMKLFIRLYLDKNIYHIKMIKDKKYFSNIDTELLIMEPFTPDKIINICNKSRAIIDITHSGQHGLTMRTIEALGMQKKIVTNNKIIKEYDFYNNNDFFVVNNDWKLPSIEWLEKEYSVENIIREKYSIESWVKKLMGVKE